MTTSDKLREIAAKWELTQADLEIWKVEGRIVQTPIPEFLSDLTALISENCYPKEFVEWVTDPIHIHNAWKGNDRAKRIDELFNYWKENEK